MAGPDAGDLLPVAVEPVGVPDEEHRVVAVGDHARHLPPRLLLHQRLRVEAAVEIEQQPRRPLGALADRLGVAAHDGAERLRQAAVVAIGREVALAVADQDVAAEQERRGRARLAGAGHIGDRLVEGRLRLLGATRQQCANQAADANAMGHVSALQIHACTSAGCASSQWLST